MSFHNRLYDTDKGLFVPIWCYVRSFAVRITHVIVIVQQGVTEWPGNYGKIMSHSNFKLHFANRSWDTDRGF